MITALINLIATVVVCLTVLIVVKVIAYVVLALNGLIITQPKNIFGWIGHLMGWFTAQEEDNNGKSDRDN